MAMTGKLWDFAVALYAAEGVKEACLAAQDEHGIDVTYLLASAWAGVRGIPLAPADFATWDGALRPWREAVVQLLRRQRRAWKGVRERDYEAIKALELQAEREALFRLEAMIDAAAAEQRPADAGVSTGLTRANLAALLRHFAVAENAGGKLLSPLLAAVR
jgi:uncharacterized protein (TIGR02444 family)